MREHARKVWRAVADLRPTTILVVGYAIFLIWAYPGYMSSDSVQQLFEARNGRYNDAHPPIMSAEWAILDWFIAGPLLMLLLQSSLFLWGVWSILQRTMSPRAAAWWSSVLLVYPPVMTTMAVIWKDSQMAAYLMAGTAALLSERRRIRLLGLLLVSAACAFRYNGFAAGVPLVFFLFVWDTPAPRWWKRYAISLAAAIATVVLAFATNRVLTVEHNTMSFGVADIVGILNYTHDRSDAELQVLFADTPLRDKTSIQAQARKNYYARNAYHLTHGDDRMFDDALDDKSRAALAHAFRQLVMDDPVAYLQHRAAVFDELIGLTTHDPWSAAYNGFVEMPDHPEFVQHQASPSRLQVAMWFQVGDLIAYTVFFRVYLYLLLALGLLLLCCRDRVSLAILASGLVYEASFFPTVATPDFRYSHWLIATTCLATAWLFMRRLRGAR